MEEPMSKDQTAPPAPRTVTGFGSLNPERIPVSGLPDVYYVPEVDNFYSMATRRGMGDAFYREYIHLMQNGKSA